MRPINLKISERTTNSSYSMTSSYSVNKSRSTYNVSAPSTPSFWPAPGMQFGLRKSMSQTEVIESQRGFKPSDIRDPQKREFLNHLTKRVFKVGMVSVLL